MSGARGGVTATGVVNGGGHEDRDGVRLVTGGLSPPGQPHAGLQLVVQDLDH